MPLTRDLMTAALRRPGLIAAFALAVAAAGVAAPASALGSPAAAPRGSLTRASVSQGLVTKSHGLSASGGFRAMGSGGLAPGESGVLPRASAAKLRPPQHRGTLRITGSLRDGGTVRAAGLSWRPGRLPPGDRLLSF